MLQRMTDDCVTQHGYVRPMMLELWDSTDDFR